MKRLKGEGKKVFRTIEFLNGDTIIQHGLKCLCLCLRLHLYLSVFVCLFPCFCLSLSLSLSLCLIGISMLSAACTIAATVSCRSLSVICLYVYRRRHFQFVLKFFPNIGAFFWRSSSGFGSMPLCYKEEAGGYLTDLCKGVLNFYCGFVHDVLSLPILFSVV